MFSKRISSTKIRKIRKSMEIQGKETSGFRPKSCPFQEIDACNVMILFEAGNLASA
jgi:hypothetical protein